MTLLEVEKTMPILINRMIIALAAVVCIAIIIFIIYKKNNKYNEEKYGLTVVFLIFVILLPTSFISIYNYQNWIKTKLTPYIETLPTKTMRIMEYQINTNQTPQMNKQMQKSFHNPGEIYKIEVDTKGKNVEKQYCLYANIIVEKGIQHPYLTYKQLNHGIGENLNFNSYISSGMYDIILYVPYRQGVVL